MFSNGMSKKTDDVKVAKKVAKIKVEKVTFTFGNISIKLLKRADRGGKKLEYYSAFTDEKVAKEKRPRSRRHQGQDRYRHPS